MKTLCLIASLCLSVAVTSNATQRRTLVTKTHAPGASPGRQDTSAKAAHTRGSPPLNQKEHAKPPTTLQVNLPNPADVYTFPKEVFAQRGSLVLNVERGTVHLPSDESPGEMVVNLYGPQAKFVVTSPAHLGNTATIRSLNEGSVLQFDNAEPITVSAKALVRKPLRLNVAHGDVVWTGECSGQEEVVKDGQGTLDFQGVESRAHMWRVNTGTLTGTFHQDSCVQLQGQATCCLQKDQTLASLSGSAGSSLVLKGATLTLTQPSQFSGTLLADAKSRLHLKDSFELETQTGASVPITVDADLALKGEPPTLCSLSGRGCVQAETSVQLENPAGGDSVFEGGWQGADGFVKTGAGQLTLTGNFQKLAAQSEVREGTLALSPTARLGKGSMLVTGGTLFATAGTNLQGDLTVQEGTFQTEGTWTLFPRLNLATASVIVNGGTITSPSEVVLAEGPHITKRGSGTLAFVGRLAASHGGVVRIEEGTFESGGEVEDSSSALCLSVGAGSIYKFCYEKPTFGFVGEGRITADGDINLAYSSPSSVPGVAQEDPLRGWSLNGVANSTLAHGHRVSLHLGKDAQFFGSLDAIYQLFITSEKPSTLTLGAPQSDVSFVLGSGVHMVAREGLQHCSAQLESGHLELQAASTLATLQGKNSLVTIHKELTCYSGGADGFSGDVDGKGVWTLTGDFSWLLSGETRFEGRLYIQDGRLSVGPQGQMSPRLCVDLGEGATLSLADDASLAELTGLGLLALGEHHLQLYPQHRSIFSGDIQASTESVVEVAAQVPWTWKNGKKTFAGILRSVAGGRIILDGLIETAFALDLAEGSCVDVLTETFLGGPLQTHGEKDTLPVVKAYAPLTLAQEESWALRCRVDTAFPLALGGTVTWAEGGKTPSELRLLKGASCFVQNLGANILSPEESVTLAEGSTLSFAANQTLRHLQGSGTVDMHDRTLTLQLQGKDVFDGHFARVAELVLRSFRGHADSFQGASFDGVGQVTLNDATWLWTTANEVPLGKVLLQTPLARLVLQVPFCCQALEGNGAILCGGNSLEIRGGSYIFSGDISHGSLNLTEGTRMTWGATSSATPRLVGNIRLTGASTLVKEAARKFDLHETINVEEGAELILEGPTWLSQICGPGSLQFDELALQPDQSFTFESTIKKGTTLRFLEPHTPGEVVSLAGKSDTFNGEVFCRGALLDVQPNCFWPYASWSFYQSYVTLHTNPSDPKTVWSFTGANTLLCDALVFEQTFALQPGSSLTFANEAPVALRGRLQGEAQICKTGKGTLELAGALAWTGQLNVQEGQVSLSADAVIPKAIFELSVAEAAEFITHQDLSLKALRGPGTLSSPQGHRVILRLTEDSEVDTNLRGGTASFESRSPVSVELAGDNSLAALSVATNVNLSLTHDQALGEVEAVIAGSLSALAEKIKQLHLTGTLTCKTSLVLGADGAESVIQGFLETPHLEIQGGLHRFLRPLKADTVDIQQGALVASDALSTVENVILHREGTLCGTGTIKKLTWEGHLKTSPWSCADEPFKGLLTVQQAEIRDGATFELALQKGACRRLIMKECASSLASLRVLIQGGEEEVRSLTQRPCVLIKVPAHVQGAPTLDDSGGIARYFKKPTEVLTLARTNDGVALYAKPFTEEDLLSEARK